MEILNKRETSTGIPFAPATDHYIHAISVSTGHSISVSAFIIHKWPASLPVVLSNSVDPDACIISDPSKESSERSGVNGGSFIFCEYKKNKFFVM